MKHSTIVNRKWKGSIRIIRIHITRTGGNLLIVICLQVRFRDLQLVQYWRKEIAIKINDVSTHTFGKDHHTHKRYTYCLVAPIQYLLLGEVADTILQGQATQVLCFCVYAQP